MNKEIAKRWIKFLKEKKKAKGMLYNKNSGGRCCLGHLCEMYRQETGKGVWEYGPKGQDSHRPKRGMTFITVDVDMTSYDSYVLPFAVEKWADLYEYGKLTELNDKKPGFPNKEIKELAGITGRRNK